MSFPRRCILAMLAGGDRRSEGRADEVVVWVLAHPAGFAELIEGLRSEDPVVLMRAADAVEKVSRSHPAWLKPYRRALLEEWSAIEEKDVRWHVAQMLPRLQWTAGQRRRVFDVLQGYLKDPSSLVRTCAMQALVELVADDPAGRAAVRRRVQQLVRTGTPAMRARGRQLLLRMMR